MTTLRLLTYNVHSLRDDRTALAEVIESVRPDVAVIQEAPRRLRWRSRCAALARGCGMIYLAGGRDAGGNLILVGTRVRASAAAVVARRTPTLGRFAPIRGVAAAVVGIGDLRVGVVGLHLGLARAERELHVPRILAVADELDTAGVVLAGDLNEDAGGPSWKAFADAGYVDAAAPHGGPTFTAAEPRTRIDGVLASTALVPRSCGVPDLDASLLARASDHRPVLAELTAASPRS